MFVIHAPIRSVILGSLTLFASTVSNATPISFDDMGDASAYIFSDFNGSQNDSQNALLIGGNATINAYTVGTLNPENSLALLVQGDLTMTGGDVHGLAKVGGTATVSATNALNLADEQRNFDKAFFQSLSSQIAAQNTNTALLEYGTLRLGGSLIDNTLFVNTNKADLESVWGLFTQNIDLGTRVVINVSGSDININGKDWLLKDEAYNSHQSENVLYNFYEANTITVAGGFYGSILAPNADVIGQSGMIYGQLISDSFDGGTQLNKAVFNVDQAPQPGNNAVSVDSPASVLLFGLGMGILGSLRRRNIAK
jgi:choice-of-anchor A domain-containing protein